MEETISEYRSDLVTRLRQARGFSMRELGEKAGVSQTTILNVENGVDLKISTLTGIAKALGVDRRVFLDMEIELDIESAVKQAIESTVGIAAEQQANAA